MAGFKTHMTVSTAMGIGYGSLAYGLYNVPVPTCLLAGGLCSVSGMLPDIDSDSGVPLRESLAFAAAVVPMMLADRFRHFGWTHELIILAGAGVYLFIRFVAAKLLKKYTVHRGMFHSIPAAIIFGELAFLLSPGESLVLRWYIAAAVTLGYLSHLVLDEVYSFQFKRGRIRLKSSFGTALKLFDHGVWSNVSAYAKLGVLSLLVIYEPGLMAPWYPDPLNRPVTQSIQQDQKPQTADTGMLRQAIGEALEQLRR